MEAKPSVHRAAASISPCAMYEFISRRVPVLLEGHLVDPEWAASAKWSNAYLAAAAGDVCVEVEERDQVGPGGPGASFGEGRKTRLLFSQFLQRLEAGEQRLYLTTQQVGVAPDGFPDLLAEPLSRLAGDLVLQPRLLSGASSGLHHDFHDNLYILLRGCKRFRLWPPRLAPRMHTAGRLARLHDNGRIVYQGQGEVRADGADAREAERWEQRAAAEQAVAEAEAALARGERGAVAALAAAEDALDELLLCEAEEEGGEEGEGEDTAPRGVSGRGARKRGKARREGDRGGAPCPPSFCPGVDLALSDAQLARTHPGFPGKAAAVEVEVAAGQMLYLPAGGGHTRSGSGAAKGG
ncbi:cupin-like domain-containing protein [Haematococcus lacustris]